MRVIYRNYWVLLKSKAVLMVQVFMLLWGGFVAGVGAESPEVDEATRRAKLFEIYQKQIPLLEQFVSKYPFSERTPESLFRLGEAYFESAKHFQAFDSHTKASVYNQKAIETLEELKSSYSQYKRIDEVLFVLASAYLEAGQTERAGPVLSDLARRFPNSEVLNVAATVLGDYYFEKSDFAQAKVFYQKAQVNPDRASYAHYKLAWIAIQRLQPALALKHFAESLAAQSSDSARFDYSREIAREIIWPALEVYGAQGVFSYLEQALPSSELHQIALATLAERLSSKGETRLASQVYERLTSKYSSSPQISDWLTKYLENEEKLGRSDKISELVVRLSGAAKGSPEVKAKLFSSARKAHAMAQAEKNSAKKATQYDQAIAYYQSFLQFETDQAKKAEMEFYLGEALFARSRFQEALQAYKSAAQMKNEKQSMAAWNWYLTAEKIAPGFRFEAKHKGTLTVQDEMFLEAARYVSQFEGLALNKRRKASYQSARILYQLNRFDESLPVFKQLVEFYPDSSEGRLSAELVLDIYNLKGEYSKVAEYAKALKSTASSAKRSELNLLEEKSVFKMIQEDEKKMAGMSASQKLSVQKSIAGRYTEFAKNYPNSQLVDAALWAAIQLQASIAYQESDKNFVELKNNFNLLTSKYSGSSFVSNSIDLMGDFLAAQNLSSETLKEFSPYKNRWKSQMSSQPRESRGALGWVVYELSSKAEKRQLEREFAKLPNTKDNRRALAQGRLVRVQALAQAVNKIQLNNLKTMTQRTKEKLAALEKLEKSVTSLVEIGEPKTAIQSLYLLADTHQEMSAAMRKAPVPKNLDASALAQYRGFVEQKAASFDRKANEARALAEKTSRELGV